MASPASSSDEGEIIEHAVEGSKATSLPYHDGNGVDRQDRSRARDSRSPDYGDSRSRRQLSPRGYKRSRDDRDRDSDSYQSGGRGAPDPRRFKVHYEESSRHDSRRSRQPYEDLDRPPSRNRYEDGDRPSNRRFDSRDNYRYDDRDRNQDRYADKRPRTRSPSPPRSGRGGKGRYEQGRRNDDHFSRQRNGEQAESIKYSAHHDKQARDDPLNKRAPVAGDTTRSKEVAKSDKGAMVEGTSKDHVQRSM